VGEEESCYTVIDNMNKMELDWHIFEGLAWGLCVDVLEGLKNAKRPIFIKKCTSLEESLLQSFLV